MNYKIHNKTIFIEGNGVIGHYKVDKNIVYKVIEHYSGDQMQQKFHELGQLPMNSEAILLNDLRTRGEI